MSAPSTPLRLAAGGVTVLLGAPAARHRVLERLDDDSARCGSGHGSVRVRRISARADQHATERLDALEAVRRERPAIVLVDGLADGLTGPDRRAVLAAVRTVAATGAAVLMDGADPVPTLAVADAALRVGPDGELAVDDLRTVGQRAS